MGLRGIVPKLAGQYGLIHERNGEVLQTEQIKNTITDDGYQAGLSVLFFGGAQTQDWYLGISHTGSPGDITNINSEFTGYSEPTRPKWHSSVVSIGDHRSHEWNATEFTCRVDATTFAVFTCTETAFLHTPFLTTAASKTASGTVWSIGDTSGGLNALETARVQDGSTNTLRRGNIVVWPGDVIRLNYAVMDFGENFAATFLAGTKLFLDCLFKGTPPPSTFYVGLMNGEAAPSIDYFLTDTMAAHPTWTEFTSYQGPRPAFSPRSLSSLYFDESDNPAFLESESFNYRITANGTVGGYFIVADDNTKGGTGGTLYSAFPADYQRAFLSDLVVNPLYSVAPISFDPFFPIRLFKGEFFRLRLHRGADED